MRGTNVKSTPVLPEPEGFKDGAVFPVSPDKESRAHDSP